jgi:hypothetical protein
VFWHFQEGLQMKFARFLLILAMLPAVWPAFRASAADAPASRDELAKRLARAFKAKDQNAIMSLFATLIEDKATPSSKNANGNPP